MGSKQRRRAFAGFDRHVLPLGSELAGLDYQQRGNGKGILRITAEALTLTLLKSKTSQEGVVSIVVPRADNPRAVAAIERWVQAAGIEPGTPLIRRILPNGAVGRGIVDHSINRALQVSVERYFLAIGTPLERARELAKDFSGHSGRVGFVVSAKENGAQDTDIQLTTRHKRVDMIAHYGKPAEQKRRAVHNLPGVGV